MLATWTDLGEEVDSLGSRKQLENFEEKASRGPWKMTYDVHKDHAKTRQKYRDCCWKMIIWSIWCLYIYRCVFVQYLAKRMCGDFQGRLWYMNIFHVLYYIYIYMYVIFELYYMYVSWTYLKVYQLQNIYLGIFMSVDVPVDVSIFINQLIKRKNLPSIHWWDFGPEELVLHSEPLAATKG